ncbi:tol-pal system-associated acyl-CoA thioesterase [Veronia nyctiphanis]|uniref:Tol-pal system-associated acyl-CoA thioesterase n=1 Tax=Veronia nyctiphanis TaxID=1278244 RepID=A0A4V1LTD9_9GAMM|nr:tol-pal system-associated acyl-CoA thioesterase [Veronia nyctiphanis]RXJ74858.1 tol-pal system-associated acyl-CoA thioesterase [Veronia nyctiphanis]
MTNFRPFRWPVRVYYEDTDVGGLVYHSNFLKYFERARSELLREIGVNQVELFEQNTAFVVSRVEMDFKKGAKFDDLLTVETKLIEAKKVTMTVDQKILNQQNDVLCQAIIKIACIDTATSRPKQSPMNQLLNAEMLSER